MVELTEMPAVARGFMSGLEMPDMFDIPYWTQLVPSKEHRVAMVSSAAVSRHGEKPLSWLTRDYRSIGKDERDLAMAHVAVEHDRTAWQQGLNTIIPLDRLDEMAVSLESEDRVLRQIVDMSLVTPRFWSESRLPGTSGSGW